MVWSVDNFKNQAQSERGGVFLMFHCWGMSLPLARPVSVQTC
jgi:hypothetical protein